MRKALPAAILTMMSTGIYLSLPAFAQCDLSGSPSSTLRTPLINGASSAAPMQSADPGQAPPIGSGSTPAPVTPGMGGPSTLIPSVPMTPANDIQYPSYQVPWNEAMQAPAGAVGPSTWAPPPSSTPGYDPDMVHAPLDYYQPPVSVVPINPGGGIYGSAPTQRWGGQTSADFGRYKYIGTRAFDFGQQAWGSTSEDGPCQTRPAAVPTQDLYGRRYPERTGMPPTQTIAPY
jgi:hypothetical protein